MTANFCYHCGIPLNYFGSGGHAVDVELGDQVQLCSRCRGSSTKLAKALEDRKNELRTLGAIRQSGVPYEKDETVTWEEYCSKLGVG